MQIHEFPSFPGTYRLTGAWSSDTLSLKLLVHHGFQEGGGRGGWTFESATAAVAMEIVPTSARMLLTCL